MEKEINKRNLDSGIIIDNRNDLLQEHDARSQKILSEAKRKIEKRAEQAQKTSPI